MCGILAVIGKKDPMQVKTMSKKMSHRGPDESGFLVLPNGYILSHERLAIMDLHTGKQPIKGTNNAYVIHNGEIYNYQHLRRTKLADHHFKTTCDSEVIVHLYEKYGYDFCNELDGDWAFVVVDGDKFMAARDPIGVKPFYYGQDENEYWYFSSELKAIENVCKWVEPFPPGHYFSGDTGLIKYNKPKYQDYNNCTDEANLTKLREFLIEATRKRLMSDVPLGVLLSGGLDSSLISSITKKLLKGTGQQLHSFSVGLSKDAPDMIAARKAAEYIGTVHHEVIFDISEAISEIEKIIWHLESYDVTTVRASTPMYFLARYITQQGFKVVLSGEGADEIFGGYLYFHNAPSDEEFTKETIRRVELLSTADCLRADKSTMAFGLEVRVPFLDRYFLDVAMNIKGSEKRPNRIANKPEKYILRAAFDVKDDPYLPDEILWRQKEQFSDGVGYNWIDTLINYCNQQISDEEFAKASERYVYNTPTSKEAYYYRMIFEKYYPSESAIKSVLKWIPKWQKNTDPSGRANEVHQQSILYTKKAML